MKNSFFCPSRFGMLCRKEIVENWRALLLRVLLMYGVFALLLLWNGYAEYIYLDLDYYQAKYKEDPAWNFVYLVAYWSLFGFGAIAASLTMEKMRDKTGRISVLMLPATSFEKFFSRWLISTVGYLVAFFLVFELADFTRVAVFSLARPDLSELIEPARFWSTEFMWRGDEYIRWYLMALYFFVQSLFVLGGTVWPKNSFLKTFAAVMLIVFIYFALSAMLIDALGKMGGNYRFIFRAMFPEQTVFLAFFAVFALVNWTLAYFRFKESEIIQRM